MPKFRSLTLLILAALLAALAAAPAGASASQGQTTYFEAGSTLLEPRSQDKVFSQMQSLGVKALRIELSWAKVVGVVVLLIPMLPARIKEWAYAGFAINLVSAIIAHLSIHDRTQALVPSTLTSVLWTLSYVSWRRLQA